MRSSIYVVGVVLGLSVASFAEEAAMPAAAPAEAVSVAPEAAAPVKPTVEVVTSALGSGVDRETRSIQGEATSFDPSMEVHYLTRVKTESVPTTVTHVYSVNGKEVASVPLSIKGSPWTTWSRKSVWPGDWKVELKDESGVVIETKDFTVTERAAPMKETSPAEPEVPAAPAQPR